MNDQSSNQHPTYLLEEVQAVKNGTLIRVTHYGIAKNNGGVYIRFFADWLPLALMSVYESETWLFPKEWEPVVEHLKQVAPKLKARKTSTSDTDEAKESGNYFLLPVPADIVRYQYDADADEGSKKRWRFYAIYRFLPYLKKRFEEKTKQEALPNFTSRDELIQWGVEQKKFLSLKHAIEEFDRVKAISKPTPKTFADMVKTWVNYVNNAQAIVEPSK